VKALTAKSEPAAWGLLVACVEQDKFRDARVLLSPKWKPRFSALPRIEQVRLLSHVLSTAGASFPEAEPIIERSGLPIRVLGRAMDEPRHRGDDYVVFRGRLSKRRLEPNGDIALEIAERARHSVDRGYFLHGFVDNGLGYEYVGSIWGKSGSSESWEDTGREVRARIDELPMLPRAGNEYAFLAVLDRVDEGGYTASVRIVDIFKPGVVSFEAMER
jgi:hypothetical protein